MIFFLAKENKVGKEVVSMVCWMKEEQTKVVSQVWRWTEEVGLVWCEERERRERKLKTKNEWQQK